MRKKVNDNFIFPLLFISLFLSFVQGSYADSLRVKQSFSFLSQYFNANSVVVKESDTIRLLLDSAENQFLKKNLNLLAVHYNIDINRALILQAKIWPNPNFQFGQGAYNTADRRFFELHGPNSTQNVQLQQLFLLAGKRNKQIKIAQTNTQLAEYAFFDLLRTLKSQLRTDYYTIYYLQQSSLVYDKEIKSLQKIAMVFSEQVLKGNIAKKEEIRIKSQLFSLQNEYIALKQQILSFEADLNLLLVTNNSYYLPVLDSQKIYQVDIKHWNLTSLIDSALLYRYDLKSSEVGITLGKQNLALQKSLGVPDLTLGINYSSNGSAAPNYFLLYAGFDLPFFNRNQGNIKSYRFQLSQSEIQYQNQKAQVEHDVSLAYNTVLESQKVFSEFNLQFLSDYGRLMEEVIKNYTSRNLGLLEFLDFYDSYKQNILQANGLQLNRQLAYDQVNFAVGKDLFQKK